MPVSKEPWHILDEYRRSPVDLSWALERLSEMNARLKQMARDEQRARDELDLEQAAADTVHRLKQAKNPGDLWGGPVRKPPRQIRCCDCQEMFRDEDGIRLCRACRDTAERRDDAGPIMAHVEYDTSNGLVAEMIRNTEPLMDTGVGFFIPLSRSPVDLHKIKGGHGRWAWKKNERENVKGETHV